MIESWLGLSVVAALVSAGTNVIYGAFKESRDKKRDKIYYALRVAISLEIFSQECALAITEHNDFADSIGAGGKPLKKLPNLTFDSETDWKCINRAILERILKMPDQISVSNAAIFRASQWDTSSAAPSDEGANQAGFCGMHALTLAKETRKLHKLSAPENLISDWDYVPLLQKYNDAQIKEMERMRQLDIHIKENRIRTSKLDDQV